MSNTQHDSGIMSQSCNWSGRVVREGDGKATTEYTFSFGNDRAALVLTECLFGILRKKNGESGGRVRGTHFVSAHPGDLDNYMVVYPAKKLLTEYELVWSVHFVADKVVCQDYGLSGLLPSGQVFKTPAVIAVVKDPERGRVPVGAWLRTIIENNPFPWGMKSTGCFGYECFARDAGVRIRNDLNEKGLMLVSIDLELGIGDNQSCMLIGAFSPDSLRVCRRVNGKPERNHDRYGEIVILSPEELMAHLFPEDIE